MTLQLWINDEIVGEIDFDEVLTDNTVYLETKKEELVKKFKKDIEASGTEPEYFISFKSKMS